MSSLYRGAYDRYGPAATKPLMPWRNSALARHTAYDHSGNTELRLAHSTGAYYRAGGQTGQDDFAKCAVAFIETVRT